MSLLVWQGRVHTVLR